MQEPSRRRFSFALPALFVAALISPVSAQAPDPLRNPAIDMEGYLKVSREAAQHRTTRRVTEADFLRMS